jgi:hypothetical protein
LFNIPDGNMFGGTTKWNAFVSALVGLGFEAEQLGDSAWHFEPSDRPRQKRGIDCIGFHIPHPNDKMEIAQMHYFGSRLRHEYDWEGTMFVEVSKTTGQAEEPEDE